MYAHALHTTSEGHCRGRHWPSSERSIDLLGLWLAMSGREASPGDEHSHRGPRHRRSGGPGPRGGPGGFPFGGGFGGGGFPSGPPWRGGGRKARRGDIRTAALLLLAEEPRNGYQIMQEVQERSDGAWRPSPGSVYPALQQLEDEGLIRSEEIDGRKAYRLTDAGRAHLAERGTDRPAPWEQMGGDPGSKAHELGRIMREVAFAFAQVMHTGSEDQQEQARKVLVTARRELYRILADGADPEDR
jgi:DNA-binding PadR family transcriptional regulator